MDIKAKWCGARTVANGAFVIKAMTSTVQTEKGKKMRLIDADAFIAEINKRIESAIKWGCNAIADRDAEIKTRAEQAVATFCEASLTAKNMPVIDAEPVRHGHWVEDKERPWRWICSECYTYMSNEIDRNMDMNYCPNCGAKMDEVEDGDISSKL